MIELYEEATRQLLGMEHGDTATTGDPTIKEKLCSQKYVSKVFHMDTDTGVRSNRTIVSECIGTIGACTNDPVYKIPEALRSRFLILICPSVNREGRNVSARKSPPPLAASDNHLPRSRADYRLHGYGPVGAA